MSKASTIEYWNNVEATDVEILAFIPTIGLYEVETISWDNSDKFVLNIELQVGDIWFGKHDYIVEKGHIINEVQDRERYLYLDRTYVHNLLDPTEEELSYLELVFGIEYVKLYRQTLDIIEQELERTG